MYAQYKEALVCQSSSELINSTLLSISIHIHFLSYVSSNFVYLL